MDNDMIAQSRTHKIFRVFYQGDLVLLAGGLILTLWKACQMAMQLRQTSQQSVSDSFWHVLEATNLLASLILGPFAIILLGLSVWGVFLDRSHRRRHIIIMSVLVAWGVYCIYYWINFDLGQM